MTPPPMHKLVAGDTPLVKTANARKIYLATQKAALKSKLTVCAEVDTEMEEVSEMPQLFKS
jgi:hypothetical protein